MPKKLISYDEDVEAGDRLPEVVKTEILAYTEFSAMPEVLSDLDTSVTGAELDTLAADAVLNTDTSTTDMAFVIDEDSFASDSDTKVPTQQSVKAYVDANGGGGGGGGTFTLSPTGTKTSSYTAAAGQWIPVDSSGGGAITITLPVTPPDGSLVGIYVLDADGAITLAAGAGSELNHDGSGTTSLPLYTASSGYTPLSLWRYEVTGNFWHLTSYTTMPLAADIQDSTALGRMVLTGSYADLHEAADVLLGGHYSETFGDGVETSFAITHNLGFEDVLVVVREVSSGDYVQTDITITDSDTVTLTFQNAPAEDSLRVTVSAPGGPLFIDGAEAAEGGTAVQFTAQGVAAGDPVALPSAAWSSIVGRPASSADTTAADGVTDDRAALAADDDTALAASLPLMLQPGTYKVSSNLTIDSPVWFAGGAVLKPDDGVTVTLAGGIATAPPSQIFDCSAGGSVVISKSTGPASPLWYGVTGDGSTDDHDTIQAAVTNCGGVVPIHFPPRRYRIGTTEAEGANRITMPSGTHLTFAVGAVIEVNQVDTQSSPSIFSAIGSEGAKTALDADADAGDQVIVLPSGDGAGFSVGDIIGVESEGSAGTYSGGDWFVRELHRVTAVSGDTVSLDYPLGDSYLTSDSAVFWKITTVDDITIDGAVFECGPGVTPGTDGSLAIRLQFAKNFTLNKIELRDMIGGIGLKDCYGGRIDNPTIDGLRRYSDSYGYGIYVSGGTTKVDINRPHISDTRHAFTTLGDERAGSDFYGGPRHININDGIGYGAEDGYSIWDTHPFGRFIGFNNCKAFGGGAAVNGFQQRAQDIEQNNCTAQGCGGRGTALTDASARVTIRGGDYSYNGTQGISANGANHQIIGPRIHGNTSAGISFTQSTTVDLVIDSPVLTDNLYGLLDTASVRTRIKNAIIPQSATQTVAVVSLSATSTIEGNTHLGYGGTSQGMSGTASGATWLVLTDYGWVRNGPNLVSTKAYTTPASAGAAGSLGQWATDGSYLYICTAADTWKRVAIATWP